MRTEPAILKARSCRLGMAVLLLFVDDRRSASVYGGIATVSSSTATIYGVTDAVHGGTTGVHEHTDAGDACRK
eukprot:1523207-Rhodomonas_salina.1